MFTQLLLRGAKGNGASLLHHPWRDSHCETAQSSDTFCRIINSNSLPVGFSPFPFATFPGTKLLSPAVGRAGIVPDYPIIDAKKTVVYIYSKYILTSVLILVSGKWHCISEMQSFLNCVALDLHCAL